MPKQIVYAGHTPEVSVPAFQLAEVKAGEPFEVADDVAEALTIAGTSTTWLLVDRKGQPITPALPPAPPTEPTGLPIPGADITTPEA